VGVHVGVTIALVAARRARGHARLKERPDDIDFVFTEAACDTGGGGTDIGALHAQPDALQHVANVRRAEVGVDVGSTSLSALDERFDGRGQNIGVNYDCTRVAVQQSPGVAHLSSLLAL
jgi:hypothetical protein